MSEARDGAEPQQAAAPVHPRPPTPVPEPAPRKGPSELTLRLLTAAILIPIVLYVIALGGLVYLAVVVGFTLLAQREFYALIEEKGAQPIVGLGLVAGGALPVVGFVGNEYHVTLIMTAALLGFMVAQLRRAQLSEALASISGTFFGVFYVGWLLSHAVVLRFFWDSASTRYPVEELVGIGLSSDAGIFFMIYTLVVVVLCDAGAYFAGRAWGRRKLAPNVSPGKTVEGALGGVLAGVLGGMAAKLVFDTFWPGLSAAFPWEAAVPFGIALSVTGILGDLVESLLKRDAQVKDAGALLPGMGGVLDRIDAPLLAIPIAYYGLLAMLWLRLG